ncbi:Pre-mRNA-splicing factor sap61 [Coemansia sp. RSA 451]|nr:Pre-mRNA-splicing factor sap61 [Coemansia sp. RSA 451]
MDSIAEQQRQAYEDMERLEQAVVDLMLQKLTKHRYRLIREQKISNLLDQIQARSKLITELNLDESGLRAKEMHMMGTGFDSFYAQLDKVRAHHRRNPELSVQPPELDYIKYTRNPEEADEKRRVLEARLRDTTNVENVEIDDTELETFVSEGDMDKLETMFSGDERFGRYVDLNEQHKLYINLKGTSTISYVEYLNVCTRFGDIPAAAKDNLYVEYLRSLATYFESYFARSMPLFDLPKAQREADEAFEKEWAERKENEMDVELFCEPCQRTFEKETTYKAHMSSRKHQKTVDRLAKSTCAKSESRLDHAKRIARLEHKVQWYVRALGSKVSDTRANVQRRQALTEDERMHELHDVDEIEYSDDADTAHAYNPLNLPLGWDGKPIPFWLYKLHGLSVTFSCEICGNSVYRGRSAYERHFQEPRHASNMRRLGIPNTRQFHGVASISEALELWARVDAEKKAEDVDNDTFEEYEDAEGNVFSKKTYFDLKRQGLI